MTVAYVFWHRPRPDVDPAAYVDALARFHAALLAEPPRGLIASWSSRLARPPWPEGGEGWLEDWYVLRGLGVLGALERAAVDARRAATHDAAAAGTGEGTAGLYGLVGGAPIPGAGLSCARWLAKPAGERYEDFIPALHAAAGPDASVWQRRLTVGPTPEFAVLGDRPPDVPSETLDTGPEVVVAPAAPGPAPVAEMRDATPDDAEGLSELALRSKGHWGYDVDFLERARGELTVTAQDIEHLVVRVAVRDGHVVGFSAVDPAGTPAELLGLWVDPPAIGTGVGRALLDDALATAAGEGTGGLLVESDPNAEGFYVHRGARRLGERRSATTKRLLPLLWVPV